MFHAGNIPTKDQVQFGDFWNGLGIFRNSTKLQKKIEKELAQIKEALPIGSINEKKDDSEYGGASVEKTESSSIYSESIKSKEASIIEKKAWQA